MKISVSYLVRQSYLCVIDNVVKVVVSLRYLWSSRWLHLGEPKGCLVYAQNMFVNLGGDF